MSALSAFGRKSIRGGGETFCFSEVRHLRLIPCGFGGRCVSQDTCYSTNEFSGGNESGHAEEDFVACVKVVESPSHYQVSSRPLMKSGPATTSCSLLGDDAAISASTVFGSLR